MERPPTAGSAVRAADSKPPSQTVFASSSQQVNRLYLLITVHESGTLRVSATASGKRFKTVRKKVTQHIPNQVYLKLSASALRSVRNAIKRHTVYATVKSTGARQLRQQPHLHQAHQAASLRRAGSPVRA